MTSHQILQLLLVLLIHVLNWEVLFVFHEKCQAVHKENLVHLQRTIEQALSFPIFEKPVDEIKLLSHSNLIILANDVKSAHDIIQCQLIDHELIDNLKVFLAGMGQKQHKVTQILISQRCLLIHLKSVHPNRVFHLSSSLYLTSLIICEPECGHSVPLVIFRGEVYR